QAEDGIRDFHVTGVQTCALPISAYQWKSRGFTVLYAIRARWVRADSAVRPADAAGIGASARQARFVPERRGGTDSPFRRARRTALPCSRDERSERPWNSVPSVRAASPSL